MDQDKQQRRVKVTDATAHRTGQRRAAVKPHKRTEGSIAKQVVTSYLSSIKTGALSQTYSGDTLVKNAKALQSNFGLAATEELFLLTDPTATGKAGILLSTSGVNLADGRGGRLNISWKDFATAKIAYKNGSLTIGQSGIVTRDGQAIANLLQQIQAQLTK